MIETGVGRTVESARRAIDARLGWLYGPRYQPELARLSAPPVRRSDGRWAVAVRYSLGPDLPSLRPIRINA